LHQQVTDSPGPVSGGFFFAIFVFVSFCHFLMTPVRLLFFLLSSLVYLFGGVFFLLYPYFLPRVFSILSGFACVLCFIWIFRSQIPVSLLASRSIHPLSPPSLLAEQCSKHSTLFLSLQFSNSFYVDGVGGGLLFFFSKQKNMVAAVFFSFCAIEYYFQFSGSVQFNSVSLPLKVVYIYIGI